MDIRERDRERQRDRQTDRETDRETERGVEGEREDTIICFGGGDTQNNSDTCSYGESRELQSVF